MKKLIALMLVVFATIQLYSQSASGGNLKGKLYYEISGGKRKVAAGLEVYLIPKTTENTDQVRLASRYGASCDEKNLKSAKNYKVAISDKEGYYFFSNVKANKYLIKVCTYRGGFYSFRVKTNFTKTIQLPDFKANSPIR